MDKDASSMLDFLNIRSPEDLFADVPSSVRKNEIKIAKGKSEFEVISNAEDLGSMNNASKHKKLLGCGIYDRIIPSSVDHIISRSEFLTSYTPYQAEISQGMLQSLFEYQSLMSELTAMDITNSSMYDGFTALGEAARMAFRINGKKEVLIPENIYSSKIAIMENYIEGLDLKLIKYKMSRKTGYIDIDDLNSKVGENTSAIVVENPNSFGVLDENVLKVNEIKKDSLLISYVDPISLGAVTPPGEYGSDIVVGEGQQLGIHQNFGGPLLGIMSFKKDLVRRSPGRIIGESVDDKGKRAFVMTLQTREQHIRREKAMSNICTNQALMAVAASAYLSLLGAKGLKKVALMTIKNTKALQKSLSSVDGVNAKLFDATFFSDLPVNTHMNIGELQERLQSRGIIGGIPLSTLMPDLAEEFPETVFLSMTEKNSESDIEKIASALRGD